SFRRSRGRLALARHVVLVFDAGVRFQAVVHLAADVGVAGFSLPGLLRLGGADVRARLGVGFERGVVQVVVEVLLGGGVRGTLPGRGAVVVGGVLIGVAHGRSGWMKGPLIRVRRA